MTDPWGTPLPALMGKSIVYSNPEGTMREKRADPLDDLRMDAISIQVDRKIAVVYRIKSSGEVKEDNIHWLTRIHKLRHPLLSEK